MFRKTGEIGRPTTMLAYRLKISFVAKSMVLSAQKSARWLDAHPSAQVTMYLIPALLSNQRTGHLHNVSPRIP
jgi:hypothetical protein